jgi:hypothetical protein
MSLGLDLISICPIKDNLNRIYNRLYWMNELFNYFLKAEYLKQEKRLVDVMKSKLDEVQYKETQYRDYIETLNYFTYVCQPLFDKIRSELN